MRYSVFDMHPRPRPPGAHVQLLCKPHRQEVHESQKAIQDLFSQILEIRRKADQSELLVQEICRDIRKLDYAKKHLTNTIGALTNLSTLIHSMDRLQVLAENRRYPEAAGLLQAVSQLMSQFEPYGQIPKVNELKVKFAGIKSSLRLVVLNDFKFLHATSGGGDAAGTPEQLEALSAACLVIEGLDSSVKEELLSQLCNREVVMYGQIFSATQGESAKLANTERRFQWIRKQLASKQELWRVFPETWRVQQVICLALCKVTRAQVSSILDAQAGA